MDDGSSQNQQASSCSSAQHQHQHHHHHHHQNEHRMYTIPQANDLIKKAANLLHSSDLLLTEARKISKRSALSVDSSILDASYQNPFLPSHLTLQAKNGQSTSTNIANNNGGSNSGESKPNDGKDSDKDNKHNNSRTPTPNTILKAFPPILSTTGGHSNIDHIIQYTGDYRADTIAEYKRKLKRRVRSMQPELRGTDRWDSPRIAGSRRRRILREIDLPCAPPEPPPTGYVIFVTQMTTKIRHDRPKVHHNQITVVREISKIWRSGMSEDERNYYINLCRDMREEYEKQHAEYRATGSFKKSKLFERLHGDGPWVRIAYHEKNDLEREISQYKTIKFPPRPDDMEKPEWVKKIEKGRDREMERRRVREEKNKKRREIERRQLEEANKAKEKRLKNIL